MLDREIVAHQRTLEQKIAEQGPTPQRVHPHLIGAAIQEMGRENRIRRYAHPATGAREIWLANVGTTLEMAAPKLAEIAKLYARVSGGGFGNLTGDALEIIVANALEIARSANTQFSYLGHFDLAGSKNRHGRFPRTYPPRSINGRTTQKEPDFIQIGHAEGPLAIECKNLREWLYPNAQEIKDTIIKAYELGAIPVLVARRMHYTTLRHLLEPGGILAHESLFQYFPSDQADLAEAVRHKRSLGFTDVIATEKPHDRTIRFFTDKLPRIVSAQAAAWERNRDVLYAYATNQISRTDLYHAIKSPGIRAAEDWDASDIPF